MNELLSGMDPGKTIAEIFVSGRIIKKRARGVNLNTGDWVVFER